MQTNTATALANKLAAVNKLVRLQIFILKILEHVETLSFTRIFESITKNTNRKHRLCLKRSSAVDKVIGKHIYKTYNRVYALTAKTLSL
ncbi:hypothetical protein HBH44_026510 [Parastagonospora nodorum]|nr:hypothetical protein HBH54_088490 [Parastagonospora nodorum]KAH4141201.1 hypothetical protein HBH45_069470 [Parastagonospora nodorum]KAH4171804.1 hypothetical protein HBH44_026510 [Parastagonospora nodorum]KAH4616626.1 hypothetical protein HBH55_203310 [Parastagonospora nodorum]KAH4646203.1 hypothetical protein HBH81_038340 [Parastagonospora nodorum]